MVDKEEKEISFRRQCKILGLNRSGLYYEEKGETEYNLELMNMIDKEYTDHPAMGVKRMRAYLRSEGKKCGQKRVRRLMRKMGLEAVYPKPRTSIVDKQHEVYPYLLRNVQVERVNQVWSTDITYVRLKKGYAYLVVIMDWYSRKVLSWRLSNTIDAWFCCEALEEALMFNGKPEIFTSDQGTQFTSLEFIGILKEKGISISMSGKGRALDNIYVERLWRTVKYDDIYVKGYETMKEASIGLKKYFKYYNQRRLHSSLSDKSPDMVYYGKRYKQLHKINKEKEERLKLQREISMATIA